VRQLEARRPIIELPNPEEEISTDALLRNERRKRISEYIREKPSDSARLLKVWLAED
jgi:flagellar biosynthesis/type III secretory pathway M-ring protein FliF/YscJ